MKEVVHGVGPFAERHGWNGDLRQKLITDSLVYAQTLDKLKFRTFVCSVDMATCRHLKDRGELLPSAVAMCNYYVPGQVLKWFLKEFGLWSSLELRYFFDRGENFKGAFEEQVRRGQRSSRQTNHWHLVRQIENVDMRIHTPLQLADFLAWAHHRRLNSKDAGVSYSALSEITDAILPMTRMELDARKLDMVAAPGRFGLDAAMKHFK